MAFGFDFCYWSVDPEDPKYASQEMVSNVSILRVCPVLSFLLLCLVRRGGYKPSVTKFEILVFDLFFLGPSFSYPVDDVSVLCGNITVL